MRLLETYIAKTVMTSIALITVMLIGLQVFILFVSQLDNLGKGDYNLFQAAMFVLFRMPYEVYLFFPMASLLGCLIGLGVLANNRELLVMRAAGMSIWQVTMAVLKTALFIIIIMTVLGETVIPRLVSIANERQQQALSGGQSLRTPRGTWLRYRNDFITFNSTLAQNSLENVEQFHFDAVTHSLILVRTIDRVLYAQKQWHAYGVAETLIDANQIRVKHYQHILWDIALNPNVLKLSGREPDEMSLIALHEYLRDKKKNKQAAINYQVVYWQRIIQPLTTMVMMILAIPFIFGPLRSSTMGSKLLIGASVGFGFHIINRFFGSMSQVFQLSPILAAIGPTLIFALIGFYLATQTEIKSFLASKWLKRK